MKWWNVMKWMKWMKWDEMDEGMKWDEIDEIWWNRRRNEITNYNNNMTNAQTLYYTLYNTFLLDLHACLPRTVSSVCFVLMCAVCVCCVFGISGCRDPPAPLPATRGVANVSCEARARTHRMWHEEAQALAVTVNVQALAVMVFKSSSILEHNSLKGFNRSPGH